MTLYHLERSLFKISGRDGENFLQGQFSNDIFKIIDNSVQINAYCQHQGKIIGILWVFKKSDDIYISLPIEISKSIVTRLNMFKLMSDVNIEDVTDLYNQYGTIDDGKSLKITNNLGLLVSEQTVDASPETSFWEFECIKNNLPEIYQSNQEKFIPQMLNLDIDDFGVSFTKGCYPGQEVVARMHYLGKAKRRLYSMKSSVIVNVGDQFYTTTSTSLKPTGEVLRAVNIDDITYFQAVFETDKIGEKTLLGSPNGAEVHIELNG